MKPIIILISLFVYFIGLWYSASMEMWSEKRFYFLMVLNLGMIAAMLTVIFCIK
jgi:uncharacterized membrane protein YiaA